MDLRDPELITLLGNRPTQVFQLCCRPHGVLCTWSRPEPDTVVLVKGCDCEFEFMLEFVQASNAWENYAPPARDP